MEGKIVCGLVSGALDALLAAWGRCAPALKNQLSAAFHAASYDTPNRRSPSIWCMNCRADATVPR